MGESAIAMNIAGKSSGEQFQVKSGTRYCVSVLLRWFLFLLIFASVTSKCFSQALVNFNNNVLSPVPLVYLGNPLGGSLVVGTNWVAQLYYGTSANDLKPVDRAPAKFRVFTTSRPGTWSGGMRSLFGVNC